MIIKALQSFIDKDFNEKRIEGCYYLYSDEDRAKEIIKSGYAIFVPVKEIESIKKGKKAK